MTVLQSPSTKRTKGANGYSTQHVAELLGLSESRIRDYVRRDLLAPQRTSHGHFRFSFQDVVFLRAAKGLTDAAISVRQSNRALTKLKSDLVQLDSLSAVRIYANGSVIEVQDDEKAWEVESGQLTMNFSIQELAANVAELAKSTAGGEEKALADLDSDEWYNLGLDLEEVDPLQAPDAYREAIKRDPLNADAHVNLGRLYQLSGDLRGATRHYQLALASRPDHQLANYNLGTIFDEQEDCERAAIYYRKASSVPDAHYNLARIRELEGDEVNARRHLRLYHRLIDQEQF
jgi:tetratricopeptide (TPR) repeat protein